MKNGKELKNDPYKKQWMKDHGNNGQSPEEKYKANRKLDAQREVRMIDPSRKRIQFTKEK